MAHVIIYSIHGSYDMGYSSTNFGILIWGPMTWGNSETLFLGTEKRALPIDLPAGTEYGRWDCGSAEASPTNGRLVFKRTTKTGQREPLVSSGAGKSSVFIIIYMPKNGDIVELRTLQQTMCLITKGEQLLQYRTWRFLVLVGINAIPQKSRRFCWNENLNH